MGLFLFLNRPRTRDDNAVERPPRNMVCNLIKLMKNKLWAQLHTATDILDSQQPETVECLLTDNDIHTYKRGTRNKSKYQDRSTKCNELIQHFGVG